MPPPPRSPLAPTSAAARDFARDLVAREMQGGVDDAALVASAERLGTSVADGLSRWFGPYGSLALIARALTHAQADHPSLTAVAVPAVQPPRLTGLADSARVHGAKATAEGIVAMLAALADLLGRLVGDDLALNLLEQSTTVAAPTDPAPTDPGTADDAHQTVKEP